MKKKQKNKRQIIQKMLRPSAIILSLLIVSQIISAFYILKNREYIFANSQTLHSSVINTLEERRYKDPVIDITENRVYIPEARIYLPLNDTTRDLRYNYRGPYENVNIFLSMQGIVGRRNTINDAQCDKMVIITKKDLLGTPFSEIEPTKDGFRYIYKNSELAEELNGPVNAAFLVGVRHTGLFSLLQKAIEDQSVSDRHTATYELAQEPLPLNYLDDIIQSQFASEEISDEQLARYIFQLIVPMTFEGSLASSISKHQKRIDVMAGSNYILGLSDILQVPKK